MEDLQELRKQHTIFADEAFTFLMCNSQVERECFKDFEFFRFCIGDAIFVISYIFKRDYWRTFNRLRENLKHVRMFEKYCMIIPVKKDDRYFYNFLLRISLIFELAAYCCNEGFNYFETGLICVAEYEDLRFFEHSGGWRKLEHAAEFIASLGRPLTLIMNQKYLSFGINIATFADAVQEIRKFFLVEGNLKMIDSREVWCLTMLKKKLKARVKTIQTGKSLKVKSKGITESPIFAVADTKGSNHDLEEVIKSYFRECFSCLISSVEIPDENLQSDSLECTASVTVEICPEVELAENIMSEAMVAIECHPNPEYRELGETPTVQEGCDNEPESECLNKNSEESGENISNLYTGKRGANKLIFLAEACDMITREEVASSAEKKQRVDEYVFNALKCDESVPTEGFEKALSETNAAKTVDADQRCGNYDKNLTSQEECNSKPTFIVSQRFMSSRKSDKFKHLYSANLCPPSIRKKLDGHLKNILDKNIESQNYNIMSSGDILVCPPRSPSQDEEALVIFDESSTDEEGDQHMDSLLCLFKKMEIDSQGKESGYSLRTRRPNLRGKARLKDELDSTKIATRETTASRSGNPSKPSRRTKQKSPGTNRNETHYAEVLIRLYKKCFPSFLDKYFKTDFPTIETDIQSTNSEETDIQSTNSEETDIQSTNSEETEIQSTNSSESLESHRDICEHVFAVSARIMAKRKAVLDEPEESKRVLAFQIHGDNELKLLPLPLQQVLDSQIGNLNYFAASEGIYGVGPRCAVKKENVWAILCSDDWLSHSWDFKRADIREILRTFRSYAPVLKIAIPLPEIAIIHDMIVLEGVIDMQLQKRMERIWQ